MEFRKFGSDYVIRLERGEEILTEVTALCEKEGITLASLTGLGAVGEATLGVFNHAAFKYESQTFTGDFEIAALVGNVSTMNGKVYLHFHMTIGNVTTGACHAGHLNRGVISLTGELFLHAIEGNVGRKYSETIGLNLMEFEK